MTEDDDLPPTRQAKHVQKRRAMGLCGREGCETRSGKNYLCPIHRADARARMRSHRGGRRSA